MDTINIAGPGLGASIKTHGAELCSLQTPDGTEFLWQALPAWPRHAPVLFPMVGRLKNDCLRHGGREYRLTQHGFARDRLFKVAEQTASRCRLVLEDDPDTRAMYPFAFRFEVSFEIADGVLSVTFTSINTGSEILPASMGAHPAFNWPLRPGIAKDAHWLEFNADETAPIRRVAGGLVLEQRFPTPIKGRRLDLDESLFTADAIILDQLASTAVTLRAPGAPGLEVAWQGFPELGIWMRPGGDFLCIEPWAGMASGEKFDGSFVDKPGVMLIPPGGRRSAVHRVRIVPVAAP